MLPIPILRIARPTNNIDALRRFYVNGLGLEVLGTFADHDGFDGLMLGHSDWPYHLEFTHRRGHQVGMSPSNENLLVFYYPQKELWTQAVERMLAAGFQSVRPDNPYWAQHGRTFADPDGYRVVLQATASPYGAGP